MVSRLEVRQVWKVMATVYHGGVRDLPPGAASVAPAPDHATSGAVQPDPIAVVPLNQFQRSGTFPLT